MHTHMHIPTHIHTCSICAHVGSSTCKDEALEGIRAGACVMIIRAVGGAVAGAFLSEVPKVCRTGLGMYAYV
jgi:hypothetical protein